MTEAIEETAGGQDVSRSARRIALDLIESICGQGNGISDAFEKNADWSTLEDRDRRFVRRLVMGMLRHRGELDDRIRPLLRHPPGQERVMNILRLGTLELTILDHPAHAAVSEAVKLANKKLFAQKGLVNAVLRKIATEGPSNRSHASRVRRNVPRWLWQTWVADHETDVARSLAIESLREPPLDLFVARHADQYDKALGGTRLSSNTIRLSHQGAIQQIEGYESGDWWVQDIAATLPVQWLGLQAGEDVLDLCAAPGGKTMQLCHLGADVTAVELIGKRCKTLEENLARTACDAKVVRANVLTWEPERKWRKILLDAPCSATGTLRRNPDILYHRKADDLHEIWALQDKLLARAVTFLETGGELVFATCSLLKSEGEARIQQFLATHPDFSIVPFTETRLADVPVAVDGDGMIRTLPGDLSEEGGMDGFFMAKLRKGG